MTRHNLDEHLSWLLQTKPSIPPPISLPPALASPGQPSQLPTTTVTRPPVRAEPVRVRESTPIPAPAPAPVAEGQPKQEMARLRTAPGSASKPSFVSLGPSLPRTAPRTGSEAYSTASARQPPPAARAVATRQSPVKHAPSGFHMPRNVEVMDLTESMSAFGSSPVEQEQPARSSRKRKSDELDFDIPQPACPQHGVNGRPKPATAPPQPRLSQDFATLDDLDEPVGPPPPYSTIPPKAVITVAPPLLSAAVRPASSSSTMSNDVERVMPDSGADEDDDDDIIDFTGSKHKRSKMHTTPSSKRRALTRQKPLTAIVESPSLQRSTTVPLLAPLPTETPGVAKASVRMSAPPATTDKANATTHDLHNSSAPSTGSAFPQIQLEAATPSTSTQEPASEDVALLRRLFAADDAEVQRMLQVLHTKEDELIDAVALHHEEFDEADELEGQLDQLQASIKATKDVLARRSDYRILAAEKEQLFAAFRQALRTKQGLDRAKAANGACKAKIQDLESSCVRTLQPGKRNVEATLAELQEARVGAAAKSVAIQSTQAPSSRVATAEPAIPSSSRIAQTQMLPPRPPPKDQRASPAHIDAYFSPKRKAVSNALQRHAIPPRRHTVTFDDEMIDDMDDEDMLAANDPVFSNRMGTPPAPYDYPDEEDFGMGDDDEILEFAQGMENNDFSARPTHDTSRRQVFGETSGNSQMRPKPPSAKKTRKAPVAQAEDDPETQFRFNWSNDVKITLRERFRLKGFRESQLQAINATLDGKDTFILMPTGGGKSLCYQLPSLIRSGKTRGVTVVVSPLLSLMEDQVQHLRALNIQAFLINGDSTADEKNQIREALNKGDAQKFIQLLYVTPEMLSKNKAMISTFEALHRRQQLARLVIDEAHCVSQWGHDFRPDYKLLGEVRRKFPGVPVMALTATATENVKLDVITNLDIRGCQVFTRSFNRPNLYYDVRPKGGKGKDLETIAALIKEKYRGKTGIVYCLSRKNCEDMAEALLKQHKIKASHYHAGLKPEQKSQVQKDWQAGRYQVIVATIAFGMGIDKADVRFVIHNSIPKSLEGYYQETGRAGRDGKRSGCYLFYNFADASKLNRMVDEGDGDWEQKERQRAMIKKMVQFCENKSDCRRVQVLAYFNEVFHRDACDGNCDNCNSTAQFETLDFTDYAEDAIELVRSVVGQKVTILQCVDIFRGVSNKRMKDKGHTALKKFGAGQELDRENAERLFNRLLSERAIAEDNVVNKRGFANQYVMLGQACREFGHGRGKRQLSLQIRVTPAKAKAPAPAKKRSKKAAQDEAWDEAAGSRARALPLSTNVSSPIQAVSKRKATKQPARGELHANGYARDNFVISDPEDDNYAEEDDEDDSEAFESMGFAPVREKGRQMVENRRELGPPILSDNVMASLDEWHRETVEAFVEAAKEKSQALMVQKSLRTAPFSDTILRQMAINFTDTTDQMNRIPGIDEEKVKLYGKLFCKLVKDCREEYEAIKRAEDEPAFDPNLHNVIDLVSDDEDEYGSIGTSDFEEDNPGEASTYFRQDQDVVDFNAKFAYSKSQAMSQASPAPPPKQAPPRGGKRSHKSNYRARQNSNVGGGFRSGGGVAKRKGSSRRSNGSASRASGGSSRVARGGTRGGGGISMMPT